MGKKRVPLHQNPRGFVDVDPDATKGATVGVDLLGPDGRVLSASQILNPTAAAPSNPRTVWRTILEIPSNIKKLAELAGRGFAARSNDGDWTLRVIEPGTGIEVSNGDGEAGNPSIGLADVPNSGAGTLQAITRDAKGRVTGTRAATITGTAQQIVVANGTAAAGLPTLSLAAEVVASLVKADSAVQEVRPGAGVTIDSTDPRRPIINAAGGGGIPEAPTDGSIYARGNSAWDPLTGPLSRYVLLELPPLLDQIGRPLTDQLGRPLYSNSPQIPVSWVVGAQATVKDVFPLSALPPVTPFPRDIYVSGTSGVSGIIPAYSDGVNWLRFSDNTPVN